MNDGIFRAYDIRGLAEEELTDEVAFQIGQAYGSLLLRTGGSEMALCRDCRLSSERLFQALSDGILSTGVNIIDVGVGPSPLLYWAVFHLETDGGIQITGSHNPKEYNGFKIMLGQKSLHGEALLELLSLIKKKDFEVGKGLRFTKNIEAAYVDDVTSRLNFGERPLRVLIDGGNGAGGPLAMKLMKALPESISSDGIFIPMDGNFPNHHPDPTVESNLLELRKRVLQDGYDLGIAYDGDADRIGVIDEKGNILWGDKLLVVLSRELLKVHPGATIIGEVKCSQTLYDDIKKRGGKAIMSAVGHSIIKDRLHQEKALLAGEMSGHIFYQERWYGFDDALYVTARILEILSQKEASLSALLEDLPETFASPEIRLSCPDKEKFVWVEKAVSHYQKDHEVSTIDGARIQFDGGWGLIRASNTQPVLVLRAEAQSEAGLKEIRDELEGFIRGLEGA